MAQRSSNADSSYLKQEALKHLAWAKDPEGVGLAAKALSDVDQTVRAQAATALARVRLARRQTRRSPRS